MTCDTFSIIRGTDKNLKFTKKDSEGNPVDITGYTIFFTVKLDIDDPESEAKITKTIQPGDLTDPTNGMTYIPLTYIDTDIPADVYYYDIKWKDADGKYNAIKAQTLEIIENVTDRVS